MRTQVLGLDLVDAAFDLLGEIVAVPAGRLRRNGFAHLDRIGLCNPDMAHLVLTDGPLEPPPVSPDRT